MTVAAVLIALGIGTALGLLGGGGSIVAVPLLTMVAHFSPKDAVTASLAIVGVAAAAGAISGLIRGVLPVRIALVVGLSATVGSTIGSTIGSSLADRVQLGILGVVMLVAAVIMWRRPVVAAKRTTHMAVLAAIGAGVGMLTGLVGVGGGFLIVPALAVAANLPMPKAAAASLFVIALAAVSAIPRYVGHTTLAWPFIIAFALIAAAGSVLGGMVAPRLPQRVLQRAFAVTLVILGSYVLLQA